MFRRVLLVAPPSSSYLGAVRPPEGLGYLAEALQAASIECNIVDLRATRDGLVVLRRRTMEFQPDLIGFSLVTYEYKRSYDLIRQVRHMFPSIPIIVGGPHVAVVGTEAMDECHEIDFGISHEGEHALVYLCRDEMPLGQTPGLLYRLDGQVTKGAPPAPIMDLDTIAFPRYEGVGLDARRYACERNIVTSRGCPYRCTFCPNSMIAKKFRARSAENVVDELEYWYERGIKMFNVNDDNFTLIKERVHSICDEIERRRLKGLFIRCANGLRADKVDRQLLARMKEVGVREVAFGADGGNDRVLRDLVHKGETIADIERALKDACDLGLSVKLFIVVGHPGEGLTDVEDSFALAQRYPISWVYLNNPIPYPGTELFDTVKSRGLFVIQPEEYLNSTVETDATPVFETPELPLAVRRQILERSRRIERNVKRRAVMRLFAKYPVIRTVAGHLFASSLGQWLFFRNRFARSVANSIWYRLLTQH